MEQNYEAFTTIYNQLHPKIFKLCKGYFNGDEALANDVTVAALVKALKTLNPDAVYLCDPVTGDASGLYVPEETAAAIRDHLMPLADIATPNRFELGWLSGRALEDNNAIIEAALQLAATTVVATSAHAMMTGSTGNLLIKMSETIMAEHRLVDGPTNGLGDLTSAIFLARRLSNPDSRIAPGFPSNE